MQDFVQKFFEYFDIAKLQLEIRGYVRKNTRERYGIYEMIPFAVFEYFANVGRYFWQPRYRKCTINSEFRSKTRFSNSLIVYRVHLATPQWEICTCVRTKQMRS